MVCEPCEQGDEPIRRLAKRAREEYERLGPYEDIGECIEARNGQAIVAAVNAVPRLLAEIERLTEALYEAGMQVGLLEREVARLRRGIEAYRKAHGCGDLDSEWPAVEGCASCDWERGEGKVREESGDER